MSKRATTIANQAMIGAQALPEFIDPQEQLELELIEKRALFLLHYENTWDRSAAAKEIGVPPRQIKQWEAIDPLFAEQVEDIRQAALDAVEAAVKSIVLDAKNSPQARTAAAKLVLEGNRPEKYRRQAESGPKIATQINFILGAPPTPALVEGRVIEAEATHAD